VARFTKKPLRILDNLYQFIGGLAGLEEFELSGAIQPVHDVSREAELSGFGQRQGYWTMTATQTHAGAGELLDVLNPYAQATDIGNGWINPLPTNWRIWIIDIWAYILSAGVAGFVEAQCDLAYPAGMVGPNDNNAFVQRQLLYHADTASSLTGGTETMVFASGQPSIIAQLPRRIELAQLVTFGSEASAAATIREMALLWVGEVGATPPGLR